MIFALVTLIVFVCALYGGYRWGSNSATLAAVQVMEEKGFFDNEKSF